MRRLAGLLAMGALSACSLAPPYVRPTPAIPASWPIDAAQLRAQEAALPILTYRDVFRDPRLIAIIDRALANNQDLKRALADIAAARGLYRVQRAALLPTVDATAGVTRRDGGDASGGGTTGGGSRTSYSVDIGASAFELDLFGRIRSLSGAALDTYLATEAASRATRLTLTADIAQAYFTYAADRSLLEIARDTRTSASRSVELTRARLNGGVAPRTDLRQAETILATAESDLANLTTIVRQDRNALDLLVGAPVADGELPPSIESVDDLIAPVPAGMDSSILLRRPDIVEAEYQLRAANARIGAARAAFFPRISLTGLLGFASNALGSLFSGGSFGATSGGTASLPIFDWGANKGNLDYARAQAAAATAAYQKTIQAAFRDVSDALARRATIADQFAAQQRLEAAARDTAFLTDARYRGGIDTFLDSLDAQRTFYTARRSLTTTRLLRADSVVALYRSVGTAIPGESEASRRPQS